MDQILIVGMFLKLLTCPMPLDTQHFPTVFMTIIFQSLEIIATGEHRYYPMEIQEL